MAANALALAAASCISLVGILQHRTPACFEPTIISNVLLAPHLWLAFFLYQPTGDWTALTRAGWLAIAPLLLVSGIDLVFCGANGDPDQWKVTLQLGVTTDIEKWDLAKWSLLGLPHTVLPWIPSIFPSIPKGRPARMICAVYVFLYCSYRVFVNIAGGQRNACSLELGYMGVLLLGVVSLTSASIKDSFYSCGFGVCDASDVALSRGLTDNSPLMEAAGKAGQGLHTVRMIDESSLWLGAQIAKGGWVNVHKGVWHGAECAVKVYNFQDITAIRGAIQEAEVCSILSHSSIVTLHGISLRPPRSVLLIMELCLRDLREHIERGLLDNLSFKERCGLGSQVSGLQIKRTQLNDRC